MSQKKYSKKPLKKGAKKLKVRKAAKREKLSHVFSATAKKSKTPNVKRKMLIPSGPMAMQDFIRAHGELINLTEMERIAKLPEGTLRHIRSGQRIATRQIFDKVRDNVMPRLCELIYTLQSYGYETAQIDVSF